MYTMERTEKFYITMFVISAISFFLFIIAFINGGAGIFIFVTIFILTLLMGIGFKTVSNDIADELKYLDNKK